MDSCGARLRPQLSGKAPHLIVLRGGMGRKQRAAVAAEIEVASREAGRVLMATGHYIGEGFDDARLDTLFLTFARFLASCCDSWPKIWPRISPACSTRSCDP